MKIVLASNNQGKLKEFQSILGKLEWELHSQSEYETPEAEETGLSFIENAILKARNAARYSKLPALADDSGLEVLSLKGEPGIYSARYSGPQANDKQNNLLLLKNLEGIENRRANFRCCLALVRHEKDPCPLIAEGIWQGEIAYDERGYNGFGYDPLFIVNSLGLRSAELETEEKNTISHRALALQALLAKLPDDFV